MINMELYRCKNGHNLLWTTEKADKYPLKIFACEKCGKADYCDRGRWNCEECRIDVCKLCRAPVENEKIDRCLKGHIINWKLSLSSAAPEVECCQCKRSAKVRDGVWYCESCGLAVCRDCKPLHVLKDSALTHCPLGHQILWNCSAPNPKKVYECSVCERPEFCSKGRWVCMKCDYSICKKCRPVPWLQPKVEPSCPEIKDKFLCKICCEREVSTLLRPCGHVLCSECASEMDSCPFDRSGIECKYKLLFP